MDRSAFDRIIQAGGYVSVNSSGNPLDANAIPVPKDDADAAFNRHVHWLRCLCGHVQNASAMLFVPPK